MTIDRLSLKHFSAFASAEMEYASGINVFIGTNATGKSHVMKVLYSVLKATEKLGDQPRLAHRLTEKLTGVFKPEDDDITRLIHREGRTRRAKIVLGGSEVNATLYIHPARQTVHVGDIRIAGAGAAPTLFFPTREILAMYEGFVSAYTERELSFDETYNDICIALARAPLKAGSRFDAVGRLLRPLDGILGGKVVLKGGRFYLKTEDDELEAHLIAEGHRKLGALTRLIRNGSLQPGMIFFWDEPEANLNPRLVTVAANFLIELAASGVQLFVTTHDYLLASRLSSIADYQKRPDVSMRFFLFHRAAAGGPVVVDAGDTMSDLPENPIVDEFAREYDFETELFAEAHKGTSR